MIALEWFFLRKKEKRKRHNEESAFCVLDVFGFPGTSPSIRLRHLNISKTNYFSGSVWKVSVTIKKGSGKGSIIPIGTLLFESDEVGFYRLGTFDEMLGCNKCNAIYHKDTRYGPMVGADDNTTRTPVKMYGSTKYYASTCKQYHITGSKSKKSITFESGPLTQGVTKTKTQIW